MEKIKKIQNKKNKSKIVCLTAYSKNFAEEVDKYVDIVLVGDSLGSVLYNYDTTRKVNLEMMIEHTKSVRKGIKKSLLVIDLPYNTYRNKSEALKNSKRAIACLVPSGGGCFFFSYCCSTRLSFRLCFPPLFLAC